MEQKTEHNVKKDPEKQTLKSHYYLKILWLILIMSLFVLIPPNFSDPKDRIITIVIGGFWLGIAFLLYKGNKSVNK